MTALDVTGRPVGRTPLDLRSWHRRTYPRATGKDVVAASAIAAVSLGLAFGGCGGSSPTSPSVGAPPTLASLEATIFLPKCSGCHTLATTQETYANTVGVASDQVPSLLLVRPGDPDGSYLLQKVAGAFGIHGEIMPPEEPLGAEDVAAIRAWILAGASND